VRRSERLPLALTNPNVCKTERPDGTIILECAEPLGPYPERAADALLAAARTKPDQTALGDRFGPDPEAWRRLSYGELEARSGRLAQGMLDAGLGSDRPILLISDNRIEAALVKVAAYRAGVPIAPVTPAYSAGGGDAERLRTICETLQPAMVVVDRRATHEAAVRRVMSDVPIVGAADGSSELQALAANAPSERLAEREASINGDTVAKILFTSGSTGTPKGAINTHRMLTSNVQALRQGWPFVEDEPPVLADWLPWSHTFGGNFVFDLVLMTGGSLYIDDGRPLPATIMRSVRNSADVQPTIHLNAPRGLDMVGRILAEDEGLARAFFERLGLVFFASAGLPSRIRDDWRRLIDRYAQRPIAFCSAWGTTETAPTATALNFEADKVNNIGNPIPGTTIKLSPLDGRYELRVKGPNISPGYLNRPDLTEPAFDEEGYFRTGDAGALADPADPAAGILIEGRLAEDFKLATGVWVNVSGLRAQLVEALGSMARDVVISGPNRDELAMLVFLDVEQCQRLAGEPGDFAAMSQNARVRAHIEQVLAAYNRANPGSSRRIARFHIMDRNLDPGAGELTEKGAINQRAVLKREGQTCDDMHGQA
jgi:feruloyl-CoA synthase